MGAAHYALFETLKRAGRELANFNLLALFGLGP